jgi:hypothetical protein
MVAFIFFFNESGFDQILDEVSDVSVVNGFAFGCFYCPFYGRP